MSVSRLALILGTMILWVVPAQAVDLTKRPSRNHGFARSGGRRSRSSSWFLSGRSKRDMR